MVAIARYLLHLFVAGSAAALTLTDDNWNAQTSGKLLLVRFWASGCAHDSEHAWKRVEAELARNTSVLVGDVDCEFVGRNICSMLGASCYPSIKYGSPHALEDYKGTLEDLPAFVEHGLGFGCGPAYPERCREAERRVDIQKSVSMPAQMLAEKIQELDGQLEHGAASLEATLENLQERFEQAVVEPQELESLLTTLRAEYVIAESKWRDFTNTASSRLLLLRQVQAMRNVTESSDAKQIAALGIQVNSWVWHSGTLAEQLEALIGPSEAAASSDLQALLAM